MSKSKIDKTDGGGPWILDLPALDAGEAREIHLRGYEYRGRKGYFRPWLPLDNVAIKNRDPDNSVLVTMNGLYEVLVEPNAADTYGEAGVTTITVENLGATTIPDESVILQVSVEPYDADDAARTTRNRHPVEKVARGLFGL